MESLECGNGFCSDKRVFYMVSNRYAFWMSPGAILISNWIAVLAILIRDANFGCLVDTVYEGCLTIKVLNLTENSPIRVPFKLLSFKLHKQSLLKLFVACSFA